MRMLARTVSLSVSLLTLTWATNGHARPRDPQPEVWTMGVEAATALFDAALPPGARTATRVGLAALGSAAESAGAGPQRIGASLPAKVNRRARSSVEP